MYNIRENIMRLKYEKKALQLNISLELLYSKNGDQGIHISKMINRSLDKEDFNKYARWEIKKKRITDYFHHSLIMGLYFGYYNVFPYMYISQNIRNQISVIKPNKEKTIEFIRKNEKKLAKFFENKYGLDYCDFQTITKRLFSKCQNLNSPIISDYSKILMGNDLYVYNHNNKNFIGCENCINYFDNLNIKEKKLVK